MRYRMIGLVVLVLTLGALPLAAQGPGPGRQEWRQAHRELRFHRRDVRQHRHQVFGRRAMRRWAGQVRGRAAWRHESRRALRWDRRHVRRDRRGGRSGSFGRMRPRGVI